jgi:hypothetical protein
MWADEQNKKPIECAAREYCTRLFAWLEHKFEDNALFPTTGDFPKNFSQEVQVMLKRMVRSAAVRPVTHALIAARLRTHLLQAQGQNQST